MASVRAGLIFLGFLALTLPLMPVQFIFTLTSKSAARGLPLAYHCLLSRLLGMTITVEGALPKRNCLIVSNHVSWLDIPLLSAILPVSFIAKREVKTWPLFGAMAKLQRTVFVDRDRRQSTASSAGEIVTRLQQGDCLVLFPEGTSSDGSAVLPFKSSYFAPAEHLGVATVPVTLVYPTSGQAWHGDMELLAHLWQVLKHGPFEVRVIFHPPLEETNRKAMAQAAETAVRRALHP